MQKSISQVKKSHIIKFAAKCRRYMLAYLHDAKESDESPAALTYEGIEKFQKKFKTHHNMADSEKRFLEKVWVKSTNDPDGD